MEKEQNYINNNNGDEQKESKEKEQKISYEDLIAMYYYEAKSHQNPFYEKHFERVIQKLKYNLMLYIEDYLRNYSTDASIQTAEGALYSYFEDFHRDLKSENDPKKLCQRINAFIMYIHDRLRLSLGEELLGFSACDLEALNYIDIDKPLNEQDKIIWDKIQREDEKYEK